MKDVSAVATELNDPARSRQVAEAYCALFLLLQVERGRRAVCYSTVVPGITQFTCRERAQNVLLLLNDLCNGGCSFVLCVQLGAFTLSPLLGLYEFLFCPQLL